MSVVAQLRFATEQNRVVFSFNTRDFVQLHKEFMRTGQHHTGIIVSDQIQVGLLTHRLLKLLDAKTAVSRPISCGEGSSIG